MPKLTPEERLAQIDASRQRWQRRLTRATNALGKLERQRKHLAKAALIFASKDAPVVATVAVKKPVPVTPPPKPKAEDVTNIPASELPIPDTLPGDDLGIPAFLQRERPRGHARLNDLAGTIGPAIREAAQDARIAKADEKRKAKSRGRIAKLKAKARGDLTAMPLTGRAALDAIRRGSR